VDMKNQIDQSFVNSFKANGFVVLKGIQDSAQIAKLAVEVDRVHSEFDMHKKLHTDLIKLGEWCIKNPQLVSSDINNFFFSEIFRETCLGLVGNDVDFYWATTANKPPSKGRAFPWHQDSGYGKGPLDYLTCWVALDDVDEENGCLWAIPGSHKLDIFPHEFRKSSDTDYGGVFLKDAPLDIERAIPIRLKAGQIACFHSKLIHETRENRSLRRRRGLISAYAATSAIVGHSLGPNELPQILVRS